MTLVEIALDDVAGVRRAALAGAGRLELCHGLADNGGTTPSAGLVQDALDQLAALDRAVPLMVLIRPRGGDFVYDAEEVRVMRRDVELLRGLGVTGFVIGALTPAGEVDAPAVRELIAAAEGAAVTFHRAFDSTRRLPVALETLVELGIRRILSSGGRATALEGVAELRALIEQSADRIGLIAGGSVRVGNVRQVVAESGVAEVHLRAAIPAVSRAAWRNPEQAYDAAPVSVTDGDAVRAVVEALR